METDGGVAREGEWVCKGFWLNDVGRAPCWYWLSEKEVVVHCKFVLCPNLDLNEHSTENDLPRMIANYRASILLLNPICLSDKYHDILMDAASLREGLDYDEEIPESASESSESDDEMDDDDEMNSESDDSDGE